MLVHMLNDVENIVNDIVRYRTTSLTISYDIGYGKYSVVANGTSLTMSYDVGAHAQRC